MKKKTLFFCLFLLQTTSFIFSMHHNIHDATFFTICKSGTPADLHNFITYGPAININLQNEHGETPLLHATIWNNWGLLPHLLMHGADKNIKDHYGQSFFSKVIFFPSHEMIKSLLRLYTLQEINTECKAIPLRRDSDHNIIGNDDNLSFLNEMVNSRPSTKGDSSALTLAYLLMQVPYIIQLLQTESDENVLTAFCDPKSAFLRNNTKATIPFIIREYCNNGPSIPYNDHVKMVWTMLDDDGIKEHFVNDVTYLIKQKYAKLSMTHQNAPFFKTLEAHTWKPVCIQACKLNGFIKETDEITNERAHRCLAHILLLPQEEKTKLNVKLLESEGQ